MGQDKYRNDNQGLEGMAEDEVPETSGASAVKDPQTPTNSPTDHKVILAENVKVSEGG